jgi:hypothetical protein
MFEASSGMQLCWDGWLSETATWIVIIMVGWQLVTRVINVRVLRNWASRFCEGRNQSESLQQLEFNKQAEKPKDCFAENYAQVVQLVLISCLYACITPLSFLICLLYLLVLQFLERACFAFVYQQPGPSDDSLFLSISATLWKTVPLLTAAGQLYLVHLLARREWATSLSTIIIFSCLLGLNLDILFVRAKLLKATLLKNLIYDEIKPRIIFCYSLFNPLYSQPEPPKADRSKRFSKKNDTVEEELNIMSRSLEDTLKQKLFNSRSPCLEKLGKEEVSELNFEYEKKVDMSKWQGVNKSKWPIPPIFKKSKLDMDYLKDRAEAKEPNELVKLNAMVDSESDKEGEMFKNKVKEAIRESINRVQ